jgi:ABC-2 type transport system permease protein
MRLFFSGIRKLIRRPASWVTGGIMAALVALIIIAIGGSANQAPSRPEAQAALQVVTFPGAYVQILSFLLGLGGLFAVIYGAAIAGSEWSWGTLKAAVARGESRSRYWLISFAAIAAMIAVGLLLVYGVGIVAGVIGANLGGVSTSGLADSSSLGKLPEYFARGWFGVVEEAAIGFTVATLARSQLAGIGAGIGLYFAETFARFFFPDVIKYLPFDVANAALGVGGTFSGGGGGGQRIVQLPADQALLVVAVWLVGALVVAAIFTERAEITG